MNTEKENQEVAVIESQAVKLAGDPQERIKQAKSAAGALMKVSHPLELKKGQYYLPIGDWQTIGSFYGLSAGADESEPIEIDNITGFRAKAVVRKSDGTIISSAIGYCMNEGNWMGREKFAQASMAQTRACSKALRMVVGWVAVLAGYQDTPAEEMDYQDQGITKDHAEKVAEPQNAPEAAENGAVCPECKGGMVDNREVDGGPRLSDKGEKLRREGNPLVGSGLSQPLYKCKNKGCGGRIWENDIPKDDGESKRQEDKEPVVEEELPF